MKNLSISTVIEKNRLDSDQAWLIALQIHVRNPATGLIDEIIRVVRNTEVTIIEGNEYEPFPFDISIDEKVNELPTLTVTIQDQTQVVQSYMNRYGGGVGFDVDLIIVRAESATNTHTEPELVEFFQITKASAASYVVTWNLGAENPLRQTFPSRAQHDEQCSFRFKDPETCAYAGSDATCDLTLNGPNGCRAKSNAHNYGGYPAILVRG